MLKGSTIVVQDLTEEEKRSLKMQGQADRTEGDSKYKDCLECDPE